MKKLLAPMILAGCAVIAVVVVLAVNNKPTAQQVSEVVQTTQEEVAEVKSDIQALVYRSPSCGCCSGHADAMRAAGFDVEMKDSFNIAAIKSQYGIPNDMQSCHTTILTQGDQEYVVEGHVPIEGIEYLLEQTPDIRGIALPGMPSGTPGMPGKQTEPYNIMTLEDEPQLFLSL